MFGYAIENRVFNNLKNEAVLDHCFVHGGNGVEAILYLYHQIYFGYLSRKELVRLLLK